MVDESKQGAPTRLTMLVATHKAADVPQDTFYLPVHVGHARNPIDLGYQPDDQGENISTLNHRYCELTGLYWAWKNLDTDVVGLSHYRRYFKGTQAGPGGSSILSGAEAADLMDTYDLVLGKPRNYVVETIDSHYRHGHIPSDLDTLRAVIGELSPTLLPAYEQVFGGRTLSLYNMFLMRKIEFDQYAEWLFAVLEATAERIGDESGRTSYQQRTLGFLGERLLNVWAASRARDLRIGHRKVVNTEGEPKIRKGIAMMKRKLDRSQPAANGLGAG